jgi:GWxTD domain-containing protein
MMKTGRKRLLISATAFALLSFMGCFSTTKVSDQNIVDIYRNDMHTLHPEFRLLHVSDSTSLLYFKINESELLYERKTLSDSFSAAVRIFCRVTFNYESPFVIDSISTVLNLQSATNNKQEYAVGSIPVKMNRGNRYLLTINTIDINGKRTETTYIDANKVDFLGSQNFLVRDPANGHILFRSWFDTNMRVAIQSMHPVKKLFVKYYRNKFPIASPPFSADDYDSPQLRADSSFSILCLSSGFAQLSLKNTGIYHIMADSNDIEGLTLFRFDNNYPDITEAYQMVAPLRYISSNEEFQKLTGSKNPKHDVDDFWLTASGGSKDRARELIRAYYNRIQDANRYFTSYQEGWKTDRGMIYLIFGAPNSIYRTSTGENWVYGEERNYMALSFNFSKMDNPFTDNDYALQREGTYRNLWYNAVDLWREGRVY